jgi:lysophospholipase L1-like esterase
MIIDVARAGVTIRSPDDFWRVRLRQALKRIKPDGVVINLGINDTGTPGTATGPGYASYGAKIDWLMQLLPDKTPVWWTNLPCQIEPKARAVGCAAVNAALAAAPERWRNLTVLDWAASANAHPNYLLTELAGVHLSRQGADAWANVVADALNARFPRQGQRGGR